MPPSYEPPLEIHPRHLGCEVRPVIELDSIGSSANRVEEGLLEERRAGRYPLPVSSTTIDAGNGQTFTISTLEAPHRVFDAWIRLATMRSSDTAFEATDRGQELSLAHGGALDPILQTSAHDLLFGVWDPHRTGPGGQVRIARSFTSTVIGLDPREIITTAARRDPLNLGEAKDVKAPKGMKLSEQGLRRRSRRNDDAPACPSAKLDFSASCRSPRCVACASSATTTPTCASCSPPCACTDCGYARRPAPAGTSP